VSHSLGAGVLEDIPPNVLTQVYLDFTALIRKAKEQALEEKTQEQLLQLVTRLSPGQIPPSTESSFDKVISGLASRLAKTLGVSTSPADTPGLSSPFGSQRPPEPVLPTTGFSSFPVAQQEEREEDEWG
jgi:hypothetical protein